MKGLFNKGVNDEDYIPATKFYRMSEVAQIIGKKRMGKNNLYKFLKNQGILDKWNQPVNSKYIEFEYFKVLNNEYLTLQVSNKGVNLIRKLVDSMSDEDFSDSRQKRRKKEKFSRGYRSLSNMMQ